MSEAGSKAPGRLAAAQRFFELNLAEAQLEQGAAERSLETERAKQEETAKELAGLDAYRRTLIESAAGASAAQLDQVYRYSSWVAARLDERLAAVEAALRECEAKRERTRDRYEDIAVLERAVERRRELLYTEQLRREQRLLDAHAALKFCAEAKNDE
jgi:flagellar export protein FliJ